MGIIIYNGQSSKDYHIQVEHPPGYDFPERDIETIQVPGRNGDLIIDNGSYKNTVREYEISVGDLDRLFPSMANDISKWLHSAIGYARLEDTYEPEYYRMATYVDSGQIENLLFHAAKITISFNCKPQRFLKNGDKVKIFKKTGVLKNPTSFESLPIITVKGSGQGTVRIGQYHITISDIKSSIVINSEIQDAYSDDQNRNLDVTLDKGFPKLVSGTNQVEFSGGVTIVEVIPKWWTL